MTRLGWGILIGILLVGGLFLSMVSFGPAPPGSLRERVRQRVLPAAPLPGTLLVPVSGYPRGAIRDSWGDARGGGTRAHHGTDIVAARGTPVVAAAAGTVEKLFLSAQGGITAYVRSPDRRWSYYYAHLAGYAPGLAEGRRLAAGDAIGYVGDTGNAGAGNTHLHFGVSRMRRAERWWAGEPVNPYPLLARTAPAR